MVSFRSKRGKRGKRVSYPLSSKLALARRVHERRSKQARATDESLLAKTTTRYEKWRDEPSRLDIRGIDTPRRRGLRVVVKPRVPKAKKPASKSGVFASKEEFFEKYRNDPLVWAFSKQFNKALPEMIAGDSKSYKHEVGMILDDSETVALAPAGVNPNPRFETPPWLRERTDLLTDSVKVTPSARNALRKLIHDNPAVVFQNASYDPKLIHKALMVLDTKSGPITFSKVPEMSGAPEIPMTMKDSHGNMIHIAPKTTDDMSNLPNIMRALRGEPQQIAKVEPLRGWKRDESEEGGNVQYWLEKDDATISLVRPTDTNPNAEIRISDMGGKRITIPGSPSILLEKTPAEIIEMAERHIARK